MAHCLALELTGALGLALYQGPARQRAQALACCQLVESQALALGNPLYRCCPMAWVLVLVTASCHCCLTARRRGRHPGRWQVQLLAQPAPA